MHTSFSVRKASQIFSEMKGEKAQLLKTIGHGCLLNLPRLEFGPMCKINRHFSAWLLKMMNPMNCALELREKGHIPISPDMCIEFLEYHLRALRLSQRNQICKTWSVTGLSGC
uniref:Uncharacterized protein n=1 Tax=Arundo donax TaxID=35708 RepID=A0A0A9D8Q4_ARUDO